MRTLPNEESRTAKDRQKREEPALGNTEKDFSLSWSRLEFRTAFYLSSVFLYFTENRAASQQGVEK
jgi:hypothetical protein